MKTYRQSAILDLVSRQVVRSQATLRRQLAARGIAATQATISRDIRDLGLVKRAVDGAYQRAQADTPSTAVSGDRVRRAVAEYLCRVGQGTAAAGPEDRPRAGAAAGVCARPGRVA